MFLSSSPRQGRNSEKVVHKKKNKVQQSSIETDFANKS